MARAAQQITSARMAYRLRSRNTNSIVAVPAVVELARVQEVEVGESASVLEKRKKVACMAFEPYARIITSRRWPPTTTMELASVSRIASVTIARRKSEKRLDMGVPGSRRVTLVQLTW